MAHLCPPTMSQGTRGTLGSVEQESSTGSGPAAASAFPPSQRSPLTGSKKRVNSLPVLLKPNMSVIDEAVFFNFKGEKVSE